MTTAVQVEYLSHKGAYPFANHSVLTAKLALQDVFSIPYFAEARVNGEHVSVDQVLHPGDLLTFQKRFGFKGGDDRPSQEREAEGLLKTYPGLLKIARDVKAMRLSAPDSVDLTVRKIAEWCRSEFGPVTDPIKTTLELLVERIQSLEQRESDKITDGPTDFGELWYEGEKFDLGLTAMEVRLVRALWPHKEITKEEACEAVYGEDDESYSGFPDVRKRTNKSLETCGLKIISRNEMLRIEKKTKPSTPAS